MRESCAALMSALTLTACLPMLSEDEPASSRGGEQRGTIRTPATDSGRMSAGREGGVAPVTPIYRTAECGSIPVEEPTPGRTQSDPSPIEIGQLVGARIDPGSTTNTAHYWRIRLARGFYHFVLDSSSAHGGSTNIGLDLTLLGSLGADAQRLLHGNELDRRYRASTFLEIEADETVLLQVTPVFREEDYVLGVFANGSAVPSPYFAECPDITPLPLPAAVRFTLGAGGSPDEEQWYAMDLEIADYEFVVESSQPASTNMIYRLEARDRLGETSRAERLLSVNEIDTDFVAEGTLEVGEAQGHWLRFSNGDGELSMAVTATEL